MIQSKSKRKTSTKCAKKIIINRIVFIHLFIFKHPIFNKLKNKERRVTSKFRFSTSVMPYVVYHLDDPVINNRYSNVPKHLFNICYTKSKKKKLVFLPLHRHCLDFGHQVEVYGTTLNYITWLKKKKNIKFWTIYIVYSRVFPSCLVFQIVVIGKRSIFCDHGCLVYVF